MSIFSRIFNRQPEPLIPGPTIKLGNKLYTVAPMNFATLKQVTPLLASFSALNKTPSAEDFDNMVKVIWLALRRNHPRITLKEVERGLDTSNIHSITNQTMSAGGAVPKGEVKAVNP